MGRKFQKLRLEKPTLGAGLSDLTRGIKQTYSKYDSNSRTSINTASTSNDSLPVVSNNSRSSLISFPSFSSPADNENLRVLFEKTSGPPTPQPKSPTFPRKASPAQPTVILPHVQPNLMSDPDAIDQARKILSSSPGFHGHEGGHHLEEHYHRRRSSNRTPSYETHYHGDSGVRDLFLEVPQPRRNTLRSSNYEKHEMDDFGSTRKSRRNR